MEKVIPKGNSAHWHLNIWLLKLFGWIQTNPPDDVFVGFDELSNNTAITVVVCSPTKHDVTYNLSQFATYLSKMSPLFNVK